MNNKIYIICEQDVWICRYNDKNEEIYMPQNLLQGFKTFDKAKECLKEWAEKRNAKIYSCAPKPGYPGYVVKHSGNVSTYRWIDVCWYRKLNTAISRRRN